MCRGRESSSSVANKGKSGNWRQFSPALVNKTGCVAAAAGMPWEKANAKTVARIKALAAALLGQDLAFQHVPGWNEAGGIDVHLRTHLPGLDGPAEKVVADALARLVMLGRKLMEEPSAEVVAEALQGAVMKLARLLVGL